MCLVTAANLDSFKLYFVIYAQLQDDCQDSAGMRDDMS